MGGFSLDNDGDERMGEPLYEFVKAPVITAWDQPFLSKWAKKLKQYEDKVDARCTSTGEEKSGVLVGVKHSILLSLLETLARYTFRKEISKITDEEIIKQIDLIRGSILNEH